MEVGSIVCQSLNVYRDDCDVLRSMANEWIQPISKKLWWLLGAWISPGWLKVGVKICGALAAAWGDELSTSQRLPDVWGCDLIELFYWFRLCLSLNTSGGDGQFLITVSAASADCLVNWSLSGVTMNAVAMAWFVCLELCIHCDS